MRSVAARHSMTMDLGTGKFGVERSREPCIDPKLRELGDNDARHRKRLAGLEGIVKSVEGLG